MAGDRKKHFALHLVLLKEITCFQERNKKETELILALSLYDRRAISPYYISRDAQSGVEMKKRKMRIFHLRGAQTPRPRRVLCSFRETLARLYLSTYLPPQLESKNNPQSSSIKSDFSSPRGPTFSVYIYLDTTYSQI